MEAQTRQYAQLKWVIGIVGGLIGALMTVLLAAVLGGGGN